MSRQTDVALVLVGDELLNGRTLDTNQAWLGGALTRTGYRVVSAHHCPDDESAVATAVARAIRDAPTVIVTGGLGPTTDDITREGLAALLAEDLVIDAVAARRLAEYAARRGSLPDSLQRMALRPESAETIGNELGSAPGLRLVVDRDEGTGLVYAVPGVPREMVAMVEQAVLPDIAERYGAPAAPTTRTWHLPVLRESTVQERLTPVLDRVGDDTGYRLSLLAHPGLVSVSVVALPGAMDQPGKLSDFALLVDTVAELLAPDAVDDEPAADLLALLRSREMSLSTAESVTGGGLAARLTDVPGASDVFSGGVVSYATEQKHALLGVPDQTLAGPGPVSPETAMAMAEGARSRLDTDASIAVTGVAGPSSQGGRDLGEVHLASVVGSRRPTRRQRSVRLRGERLVIRQQAVMHGLDLLRRHLLGLPDASPQ